MPRNSKADKFLLRLHSTVPSTKTIRGRSLYFGSDNDKALAEYVRTRQDLELG